MKHCYAFGLPALGQICALAAGYSGRKRIFFERRLSSRYIQGHRVFHQGISTRPAIGCQAEFAQALQTFLQSEHLLVGLLTGQVDISRTYQVTSHLMSIRPMEFGYVYFWSDATLLANQFVDYCESLVCVARLLAALAPSLAFLCIDWVGYSYCENLDMVLFADLH